MHCNNGLNNKLVESLVENKVAQETGDLKYLQDSMYDFVSTLKEIILGEYSPEFFNKYVDEALKLHGSNLEEFLKIPKMGLELRQALESIDDAIDTSNQEFRDTLVLLLDRFQTTLDNMEYEARDPYDTAVELGFEGTKQEWLDHLEGDSAYEIAVKNGYKGTEEEWLEHLEGDSAYKIAVDNGFVGSKQEWLNSLKPTEGTLQALTQFMNNDSETDVTVPELGNIPSLQGYIKQMFENGGLPATPFATKALMEASALVDGDYAQVTDDTVNNGLYVKTAGAWVKSAYDPTHTSKLYTDSAVLELEKRTSTSYDALAKYGVIQSVGISSRNGSEFSLNIYESSNYIPVKLGDKLVYSGVIGDTTGIAKYNSSKGFLGTLWDFNVDGAVPADGLEFIIDDEETAYIRGCNKHSEGVTFKMDILTSTASELKTIKDDITLLKASGNTLIGVADLLTPDKLVPATGINASNGSSYASNLYEATDFIDVSRYSSFDFKGYSAGQTGIAGYDANKSFVEPVYFPDTQGVVPEEGRVFELTNPSIKYIRACNRLDMGRVMQISTPVTYTASDIAEIDNKLSNADGLSSTSSDIIVKFVSATKFTVSSKCPDGSYMTHDWIYVEKERQRERAWNFRMSSHNGQDIVAGNFNTIHIMNDIDSTDGVDDSIFVGYTHGCEWMLYAQFFLDGVEFDPATASGEMRGKEFKCHIVTDNYKPDRDLSIQEAIDTTGSESTAYAMPAQPEQVRSRRVSTITIEGNNRIKRHHKLTILKDNVQFKCLYMAMQTTYKVLENNVISLNDKDGTRNHFPNQSSTAEILAPSTVLLSEGVGYGDENCFATRFESSGTSNGYAYNIVTTQANVDSSKQKKNHIQVWTSLAIGVKVYFIPVYTTDLQRAYPKYSPDVFNTGDVIESYSESEYNVSKLS